MGSIACVAVLTRFSMSGILSSVMLFLSFIRRLSTVMPERTFAFARMAVFVDMAASRLIDDGLIDLARTEAYE